MTATLTRQYRPISTYETAGDDAVSVRDIRELADGMNNFKAHMTGKIYGRIGTLVVSAVDSAAENVIDIATRPIARGINYLMFQIGGLLGPSAVGTSTWKLYSSDKRYDGPLLFDAKYLGAQYSVSTGIAISSTSDQCPEAVDDLIVHRDNNGYTHLTLTATNSAASEDEWSALWCVAATPKVLL